ncbi:MAG TPA: hypothetical protein VH593_00650, partial [Ktedonobacteraceae bacterium]
MKRQPPVGLIISIYLYRRGSLVRFQNKKSEVREDIIEPDDVEKISREIRTDASVRATFGDVFGPAWEAIVTEGPQITVRVATYDEEDQLRYCSYSKLF